MRVFGQLFIAVLFSLAVGLTFSMVYADDNTTSAAGLVEAEYISVNDDVQVNGSLHVTGDVGIGTTSPEGTLEVAGDEGGSEIHITTYGQSTSEVEVRSARGTMTNPSSLLMWDQLGTFYASGYGTSDWGEGPNIDFFATENWTDTAHGSFIRFSPIPNGNTIPVEAMRIDQNGNVGIGTTSPAGKLDVNGSIYQRGNQLLPDYVFESDYKLESIEEHAKYMWKNKHLKAIPKADVDKDGKVVVEIGAQRFGMLEELEKSHIYIEQLHKQIKVMEERLVKLETESKRR